MKRTEKVRSCLRAALRERMVRERMERRVAELEAKRKARLRR